VQQADIKELKRDLSNAKRKEQKALKEKL